MNNILREIENFNALLFFSKLGLKLTALSMNRNKTVIRLIPILEIFGKSISGVRIYLCSLATGHISAKLLPNWST